MALAMDVTSLKAIGRMAFPGVSGLSMVGVIIVVLVGLRLIWMTGKRGLARVRVIMGTWGRGIGV